MIKVKLQREGSEFSQLSSNEYHGMEMELLQFYNSSATFLFLALSFASCCSLYWCCCLLCLSLHPSVFLWYILIFGKWEVLVHCVQGCMRDDGAVAGPDWF